MFEIDKRMQEFQNIFTFVLIYELLFLYSLSLQLAKSRYKQTSAEFGVFK
jgi:hypothetical protein